MQIIDGKPARADRVPSTIQFPYSDIGDAIAVAEALHNAGAMALSRDQLAAQMRQVPNSGNFNTKVGTAKIFGVMQTARGNYELTDLGFEIVDPNRRADALVTAFLNVPLYRALYEEFRGKRLPPRPLGLEQTFIRLGVSPKQAKNARLAFEKSARTANFFPHGDEDRLVIPVTSSAGIVAVLGNSEDGEQEAAADRAPNPIDLTKQPVAVPGIHKSILGMLDELPPPKTQWSKAEQADWLEAVATLFQVIYKSEDKGEIAVEFRPARGKPAGFGGES